MIYNINVESDLLMNKIYNSFTNNITDSSTNLIYDLGYKAGDQHNNTSFSNTPTRSDTDLSCSEVLKNLNSIIQLYSECKLLQSYANRMSRSINNKLAGLDIHSLKKVCIPPKPRTCSFEYVNECTYEYVKSSTPTHTKPHECQALQVVNTVTQILKEGGFAVDDSKFSPKLQV